MPTLTQYRYHPAYQEGRNAYAEGSRRGHNPYAATGQDQSAANAWWQGYDDEAEIQRDNNIDVLRDVAHADEEDEGMASHERSDWCNWPDEN